jgi:hypothetical protein
VNRDIVILGPCQDPLLAVNATKRAAQSKVVRMMLPDLGDGNGNIESA